jgi:hypothetical protein
MKKYIVVILILPILFGGCGKFKLEKGKFKTEFRNKEEDRDEAVKVIEQFQERINNKEFEHAVGFFTRGLIEQKGPNRLEYMLMVKEDKNGKLLKSKLIYWDTWRKFGFKQEGYYKLEFLNYYEKDTLEETFELRLIQKDDIRISAFVSEGY